MPTSQESAMRWRGCPERQLGRVAQPWVLSVGATVPAALRRLYMLERACEVEIIARSLDEAPAPIEDDVVQQYAARAKAYRASPEFGMADWKAALRQIEGKGQRLAAVRAPLKSDRGSSGPGFYPARTRS